MGDRAVAALKRTNDLEPKATDETLRCVECGAYSDGVGGLRIFCPECAEREFGDENDPLRDDDGSGLVE